ncbi:MAG: hypothetical protein NXI19_13985 [Alphaproteobacteria bacterium]|nr:hypothetical protein [Alphaproteobacteria bacterium]
MKRDESRLTLSRRRISGASPAPIARSRGGDRSGGFVAMALVFLVVIVFAIMLNTGQVSDNLGAALRYWSGVRD